MHWEVRARQMKSCYAESWRRKNLPRSFGNWSCGGGENRLYKGVPQSPPTIFVGDWGPAPLMMVRVDALFDRPSHYYGFS